MTDKMTINKPAILIAGLFIHALALIQHLNIYCRLMKDT